MTHALSTAKILAFATPAEAADAELVAFLELMAALPDPGLRRFCTSQIVRAGNGEELDAAVRLTAALGKQFAGEVAEPVSA
ncbi:MAG: hypothetical protein ACO3XL_12565 [Gemmobacter sp.]|jgi:hypothetical protein